MEYVTVLIMALGLSMDAFAVSVSNSFCYKGLKVRQSVLASLLFGLFQGGMPIIGFFFGGLLGGFITAIDHWIALVLLLIIGGKMLFDSIKELKIPQASCPTREYNTKTMLLQAVATSIDALAVGVSLVALNTNIFASAGIIAACTFVICLIGGAVGRKCGQLLGDLAQVFGGVILVGIGVKIFVEHMFF